MTRLERIKAILSKHSIPSRFIAGTLHALNEYLAESGESVGEWVEVESWSLAQLYDWLGY